MMGAVGRTVVLAFFVPLLLGCGSGGVGTHRYLALGDSYTIGESVAEPDRWPNQLARVLRKQGIAIADPEIIARTGWTTDELSAAIDAANPQGPYSLVTLLIGVNNQYRGRDPEQYRAEFAVLLRRAIGFAGGDPMRVVVVSIPDWGVTPFAKEKNRDPARVGAEIDHFNRINREETGKAGARYVDITRVSKAADQERSLLADDGLHPSARMYELWTNLIAPHARAAIQRRR